MLVRLCLLLLTLLSLPAAPPLAGSGPTEHNFQPLFDKYGLRGSLLLYDAATGKFTAYNPKRCRQGFIPASTFKIPNTLIGLETGALRDTADICKWDGVKRSFPQWNQDMTYARALRVSCVPCYQQLARRVGVARYHAQLRRIGYPGMQVTAATLDTFWLGGPSRLTSFEQIEFLRRLHAERLPVALRHQRAVKQLLVLQKTAAYTFCGKTGWRFRSAQNRDIGWFVGWLTRADGRTVFFALNAETQPDHVADERFQTGRRAIVEQALAELGWLG
ncbi:class D beta-lactamase [Hymenobacter sp. 15J16-1T3B]|uniref:class D beta-lactamase n=1 Tax=Hymenobacter sp. 15J16-1T3B TaxID=2886941 RepID=UPI001D10C603|nr:class D beta-lactamase [Hymenobacter sp. 15J16-1T3B]MCC3157494.1 class D beta-lactamase [Hymenobacter sp. 15J16-1T3B]